MKAGARFLNNRNREISFDSHSKSAEIGLTSISWLVCRVTVFKLGISSFFALSPADSSAVVWSGSARGWILGGTYIFGKSSSCVYKWKQSLGPKVRRNSGPILQLAIYDSGVASYENQTLTTNTTSGLKPSKWPNQTNDKIKGKGWKSGMGYTTFSFMHPLRSKRCAHTKF